MAITPRPDGPARPPVGATGEGAGTKRGETDDSLRAERHTADGHGEVRTVEDAADRIVDLARARADAILIQARERADQNPNESAGPDDVTRDRTEADEVLHDERAAADETLRREREDSARVLSALVPLARKSTDWKLMTERASSAAALSYRDDFLGMVSHDLNNLLGGVVLAAGMISRHAPQTPEGKRVATGASHIQLYAARMKRLIGDLTDVTSLAAGKLAITALPQDGKDLVAEALASFRLLAAEKGISLEGDAPGVPLPLVCDRGRILQVLTNLLGNAVKFTPEGGTVSARAARTGDEVWFFVMDSGPGIPEDLLEAIFERFWQAGTADRRGLGLGLYIAKSIVEAHGGRIWAESGISEGSTLCFTLPAGRSIPA